VFVYLLAACKTHPRDTWQLRSCPESKGGSWSLCDTWWPRSWPEPGGRSQNHGDTWQPQSCPLSGGRSRCLDAYTWGIRSSGYRQGPIHVHSLPICCISYSHFFPFCFKMFFFLLGFLTCSCKVIICMLFSVQKSPLHATWRHHFTQHWDARQAAETESAISFQ
jgi:hypothetical protein